MKVKIKYTITGVMEEDSVYWEDCPEDAEEVLKHVKACVEEDPAYVLDGLDHFTINYELVK